MKMKITEKMWYGHVKSMDEGHVLRRIVDAPVGKKTKRKTKTRWKDLCKRYMETVGYLEEEI